MSVAFIDTLSLTAFAACSIVVVAIIELAPHGSGNNVAVVFPPWIGAADAMRRAAGAGARLVGEGKYPFVIIVRPDAADFSSNVMREGALMVLDAEKVGGCRKVTS